MFEIAVAIGTLAAMLRDPLAWVVIPILLLVGWQRGSVWIVALAIVLSCSINVFSNYNWWAEIGGDRFAQDRSWFALFRWSLFCLITYGLGRLARRLISPASPA